MPMKPVALFDFCETLVGLQTADHFVLFCLESRGSRWRAVLVRTIKAPLIQRVLSRIRWWSVRQKRFILSMLKGIPREEITRHAQSYADWLHAHARIDPVHDKLLDYRRRGYEVWVVSAGYGDYIRPFMGDDASTVVATELQYREGRCTGRIEGEDCFGPHKPARLRQMGLLGGIDPARSVVFSDSLSDWPLFELAENRFLVTRDAVSHALPAGLKVYTWG
jgi:HAD superfamily phosphoserine phosphatase-like hydrolase